MKAGRHSAAITEEGRLFVWGKSFSNQDPLVYPQELRANKRMHQVEVGSTFTTVLDEDGRVYTWGDSATLGQLARAASPMPQLVDNFATKFITNIAVGQDFGIALG